MGASGLPDDREATRGGVSRPVRYPNHYLWYILAASLDLMLTNALINFHGFEEANALAARIIDLSGFGAGAAVVISALPVVLGLLQLVAF
jgi:hypothetical protein